MLDEFIRRSPPQGLTGVGRSFAWPNRPGPSYGTWPPEFVTIPGAVPALIDAPLDFFGQFGLVPVSMCCSPLLGVSPLSHRPVGFSPVVAVDAAQESVRPSRGGVFIASDRDDRRFFDEIVGKTGMRAPIGICLGIKAPEDPIAEQIEGVEVADFTTAERNSDLAR